MIRLTSMEQRTLERIRDGFPYTGRQISHSKSIGVLIAKGFVRALGSRAEITSDGLAALREAV